MWSVSDRLRQLHPAIFPGQSKWPHSKEPPGRFWNIETEPSQIARVARGTRQPVLLPERGSVEVEAEMPVNPVGCARLPQAGVAQVQWVLVVGQVPANAAVSNGQGTAHLAPTNAYARQTRPDRSHQNPIHP